MFRIILVLTLSFTETLFAGKVIFLHGAGCAGKTSICREMEQHHGWKVVEEDDICYREEAIHWKKKFPKEFSAIQSAVEEQNIPHAVKRKQILFRPNASDDVRTRAKDAINIIQETLNSPSSESNTTWREALIIQTILKLAKDHNVVVETWLLKPEHIQQVAAEHDVRHIIAYCPFIEIVKRTLKRNSDALIDGKDISNLRFFHQTLKGFTRRYDLRDTPHDSIADLDKESVIQGLNIVELCLQGAPDAIGSSKKFTRGEFSLEEFEEYRKGLLSKFKAKKAYVVFKLNFCIDMVLRTDEQNPAESAKNIIAFVS